MLLGENRSNNRVRWWNSDQCKRFWTNESNTSLSLTKAMEDLCGARTEIVGHNGQEVVLIPHLKLAYIEIRKCASERLRNIFANIFKADYNTCGGRVVPRKCGSHRARRCTTLCLLPEDIRSYFFFTFVRHPLARFYSGYLQSLVQWVPDRHHFRPVYNRLQNSSTDISTVALTRALRSIQSCQPRNEHMESMAMSLSSPIGEQRVTTHYPRAAGGSVSSSVG